MTMDYGEIKEDKINDYLSRLVGRVFKIIPMKEEDATTLKPYVDSLIREVLGNSELFLGDEMLIISGTLKGLHFEDHRSLRSDVFKIISTLNKIRERVV